MDRRQFLKAGGAAVLIGAASLSGIDWLTPSAQAKVERAFQAQVASGLASYTAFAAYVDTLDGTEADKDEIKDEGATLARAAIAEAEEHALKHLDATLADNPGDTEIAARVDQIKEYLGIVRTRDG